MKKRLLFVVICLSCYQTIAWSTDFCTKLNGTSWTGFYKTDASTWFGDAHCRFNETFTFNKGQMTIDSSKDKANTYGKYSDRCPDQSHFSLSYRCKNNKFSYLSNNGKRDRVDAVLTASRLYNGGGSFYHTVKVSYQLDMRKQ